jgi:hypothetical protein
MSIKSAAYNLAETETRGVAHRSVGREIQRLRSYASFDAAYDALEEMKEFGEQADDALSCRRGTARGNSIGVPHDRAAVFDCLGSLRSRRDKLKSA